ncbi:MAG: hyaD [Bacteroidetes bacterium]|nr:hyaD [Bacteroidota bacterium]
MFVSLLISTYNRKEALALSLHSVSAQMVKPDEIVIADDGSQDDTCQLIEQFRKKVDIPIVHVWHEDNGFRLSAIRNKAIVAAKGDYIIQIDGDVILNKYFIADHLELAERGFFVCGSRVGLGPISTRRLLAGYNYTPSFIKQGPKYMFNGIRSRMLRHYLAKRYAQKNISRLRGCNMAFWKEDLLRVNGYNEDLTMWGQEDTEIAYRLIHAGVKKMYLKMGGVQFHLYHAMASNENAAFHSKVLERVIEENIDWCENGILKK